MLKASTEHEFMQQGSKFSLADSRSANQMVSDSSRVATFLWNFESEVLYLKLGPYQKRQMLLPY